MLRVCSTSRYSILSQRLVRLVILITQTRHTNQTDLSYFSNRLLILITQPCQNSHRLVIPITQTCQTCHTDSSYSSHRLVTQTHTHHTAMSDLSHRFSYKLVKQAHLTDPSNRLVKKTRHRITENIPNNGMIYLSSASLLRRPHQVRAKKFFMI